MNSKKFNTKEKFFQELKSQLLWKFNQTEISDIIFDYNEYFEVGASKGKFEEDICMELGNPKLIVRDLEREKIKDTKIPFWNMKKLVYGLLVIAFIIMSYFIQKSKYSSSMIRDMTIAMVLVIISVWFFLGGKVFSLSILNQQNAKAIKNRLILYHLIYFIAACIIYRFNTHTVLNYWIYNPPFNIKLYELGPFIVNILYMIIALSLISIIYWLQLFRKYSVLYFSLISHGIGVIWTVICIINQYYVMNDPETFSRLIQLCFIVYFVSILISILFLIYCKKWLKGVK